MLVDVETIKRPIKPKADSTLCNMRKDALIEYIRTLEHNYNVAVSFNEQQAKNVLKMCEDCTERCHPLWENTSLSIEELRKMDGDPVWDNFLMEWCIVMMELCNGNGAVKYFDGGFNRLSEKRFYRRNPGKET